jgi:hypothetical protein
VTVRGRFYLSFVEVKLRDFTISRKFLFGLFISVVLIAAGIFVFRFAGEFLPHPTPTPSVDDTQASAAVVAGVEAFFNVDYREGKDAWLARFCSTSTKAGCLFAESGSTGLWKRYTDNQTVVTARVTPMTLIRQTKDEQVWLVSIQLSQPLPGSEKIQDEAYGIAIRENNAWKFDRFLMNQEIEAIQSLKKEK